MFSLGLVLLLWNPRNLSHRIYPRSNCVDNHALNSLLLHIFKAYSKVQGDLFHVPLPKIDKLSAMLNGSTVYLLACTLEYHQITLSHEVQKESFLFHRLVMLNIRKYLFV